MRSREKSQNAFFEAEEMKFNEGTADANDVFEFTPPKINRANNKENEKQVKKEMHDLSFEEAWQNYEQEPILVADWFFFIFKI